MTNLRSILSSNIKNRRKNLGITQSILAERAGTSTHYIAQIEQQNKFPSSEMLERIAYALGIDSTELFYKGPFPLDEIKLFQEGVKTDFEKRMERLMRSNR
jgi:transcriptional regulator with XRE-family HTH domain